ncbi:succinate-semialdehyde dehydrogenase [Pseudonocardia sp. EC080625-04]|uniref:NAD-dependent succinate-semialdehyde dehydrogenase n=1 Tax=unclassified Pseudonocardia TaxID=2619320 RepID=UPI0006CB381E|nr:MULTISPECIES: NAD-dependent succinate-semialdehyde dehydrogenase [unclassified Pseudonocardia]ALE74355.1 succinate-semialdehyde dehydrogenase [Pseudonocardia sp. EC080625-04]
MSTSLAAGDTVRPDDALALAGTGRHTGAGHGVDVADPATGAVLATLTDDDTDDARRAADTAAEAFAGWAATPPRTRSDVLVAAHRLMIERADRLAALVSSESGKSRGDARAEITYAAEFLRWFAEEAVRPDGHFGTAPDGRSTTVVTAQPVGVAALVTPWNFPAAMVTRKVAPALAAGCTAVLKPAAETPLTALAIAGLLGEAGVPDGAVQVVVTSRPGPVVASLLDHPAVRKLSFTGSTGVGRLLLRQAADRVVTSSMELGGNAPFVVCADADVEAAVAGAVIAKLRNAGQACTAANRFLVHADVADAFTDALATAFDAQRVGPATDPASDIGPLIDHRAVARIQGRVDDALGRGAVLANRPGPVPDAGSYLAPMVLRDVPADSALVVEETFGPVAPILTWREVDDVVRSANSTEYGLAGYVFSGDTAAALRLGRALRCGMVGINRGVVSDPAAPFGGMRRSGMGREGARDGIRAFQETQFLSVAGI